MWGRVKCWGVTSAQRINKLTVYRRFHVQRKHSLSRRRPVSECARNVKRPSSGTPTHPLSFHDAYSTTLPERPRRFLTVFTTTIPSPSLPNHPASRGGFPRRPAPFPASSYAHLTPPTQRPTSADRELLFLLL